MLSVTQAILGMSLCSLHFKKLYIYKYILL